LVQLALMTLLMLETKDLFSTLVLPSFAVYRGYAGLDALPVGAGLVFALAYALTR